MFFSIKNDEKLFTNIYEQLLPSQDVVNKEIQSNSTKINILYYKSVSDEEKIQNLLIKPLFEIKEKKEFESYLETHPRIKKFQDEKDAIQQLLNGKVLLLYENTFLLMDVKREITSTVSENTVEITINGPHLALSENIATNLNLVRERYPQPSLKVENMNIGTISKTKVAILYDEKFVNNEVLKDVQTFLRNVKIDVFQSGEQLNDLTSKHNRSMMPTMITTERPDRIVHNLAQGKVVLLIAGSPFAVIVPTVFYDFMSSMGDVYHTYWSGRFLITLRYIGLVFTVTFPALYIAITSYNPEILRVQLALSIAGSRASVPYPSFIEVLFMLLMMELLTEASIRLPKSIGPTATTVGGLILGQAATAAGLVSNIMIIIVSAVAISNFVIPVNTMSFAIRMTKFFLLLFAIFYGLIGIIIGVFIILTYVIKQDSFGQPFLKLYIAKPSETKKMLKT